MTPRQVGPHRGTSCFALRNHMLSGLKVSLSRPAWRSVIRKPYLGPISPPWRRSLVFSSIVVSCSFIVSSNRLWQFVVTNYYMADIKITTYGNMVERSRNATTNAINLIEERSETRTQDSLPGIKAEKTKKYIT